MRRIRSPEFAADARHTSHPTSLLGLDLSSEPSRILNMGYKSCGVSPVGRKSPPVD